MRYSILSVVGHSPDQPRSVGAFHHQILDEIALAERLGFDSYFLAEHHSHAYGVAPSPAVLLAAAAAHISRIRPGTAVAMLPFHEPAAQVNGSLARSTAEVPTRVDALLHESAAVTANGDA